MEGTMKTRILTVITLIMIAACSKGPTVATVDGEKISANDLVEKMRMEMGIYDPTILSDEQNYQNFRRLALENLIQESILISEAKRLGVDSDDESPGAVPEIIVGDPKHADRETLEERGIDPDKWMEAQRRRATIRRLIEKEVMDRIPVSDEQLESYYRKHISDFRENTRFHARQILVDKKEVADRIYVRLMKGEDFATVAKEVSVSPDAARGGDLGFFDAKTYPEVFAEVCQQLKPGEISKVTATSYGFQIFQLIAKRPPRQRSLDEMRSQIERILKEEKMDEVFVPWLEGLVKKASVSVNEEALKEVRLNG